MPALDQAIKNDDKANKPWTSEADWIRQHNKTDNPGGFVPPSGLSSTADANRATTQEAIRQGMLARSGNSSAAVGSTSTSDSLADNKTDNPGGFVPPSGLSPTANANRANTEDTIRQEMQARSGNASATADGTSTSNFPPFDVVDGNAKAPHPSLVWDLRLQLTSPQRLDVHERTRWNSSLDSSPDNSGSDGGGICFTANCLGSAQQSDDGLRAVPYSKLSGQLGFGQTKLDAGWIVYKGDQEIARGFADVKLLGGGRFAATNWNDGAYAVFDDQLHQLTKQLTWFQPIGDGYFSSNENLRRPDHQRSQHEHHNHSAAGSNIEIQDEGGGKILVNGKEIDISKLATTHGNWQADPVLYDPSKPPDVKFAVPTKGVYQQADQFWRGDQNKAEIAAAQQSKNNPPVQPQTSPPKTGGIYLGGKQQYKTNDSKVNMNSTRPKRSRRNPIIAERN